MIFGDDPFMQAMIARRSAEPVDPGFAPTKPAPTATTPASGGKDVPARRPGEPGWKYLQRIGGMFGLKNDAGDSQTTGGKHTANSNHYKGKAIDYGNVKNSPEQISKFINYVKANKEALGADEIIWQSDGHYNHGHVSTKFAAKKPTPVRPAKPRVGNGWV
jgi:hypothetical protein